MDEAVAKWREVRNIVEGGSWRMAEIADSLVGDANHHELQLFVEEVEVHLTYLYSIAKAWRLRRSLPEHSEAVGLRANGKPLTITHFRLAGYTDDPACALRRAQAENLTVCELRRLRQVPSAGGASRPNNGWDTNVLPAPRSPVQAPPEAPPGPASSEYDHYCPHCGSLKASLAGLPKDMAKLGLTARSLAYDAGVDEVLVHALLEGKSVAQVVTASVGGAVRAAFAERNRKMEALGMGRGSFSKRTTPMGPAKSVIT